MTDDAGRHLRRINILGKADMDFPQILFSHDRRFLAYSKFIKYVDEPGIWEEGQQPQMALSSIVIFDLKNKAVLKEIMPTEGEWIYPAKWVFPGEKLLYYTASGFDVSGVFSYDIKKHATEELSYEEYSRLADSAFTKDDSFTLYLKESGIGKDFQHDLHKLDLKSGEDRTLISKKDISMYRLSNDKNKVAFIEVENVKDVENVRETYIDNLWLYEIDSGTLKKLYSGQSIAKAAFSSNLSWSPDDTRIGMFFLTDALIYDISSKKTQKLKGANFGWMGNEKVIFSRGGDLYIFDVLKGKEALFMKGASSPAVLECN